MDITPTTTSQDMETHLRLYLRYINEKSGGEMIVGMLAPEFVSCDLAQRTLTLSFSVQHWMLNIGGTMHGGLISTAFDTSFGSLTHFFSRGHFITTTNLSIAFLEPVTENSQLVIKVTANRVGRTLC
ncbi:MAG: PaaI family thioesterase, partial [Pygmaiobacter sp.]